MVIVGNSKRQLLLFNNMTDLECSKWL